MESRSGVETESIAKHLKIDDDSLVGSNKQPLPNVYLFKPSASTSI